MGQRGALCAVDESVHGHVARPGHAYGQELPQSQSRRSAQHPDPRVLPGAAGEFLSENVVSWPSSFADWPFFFFFSPPFPWFPQRKAHEHQNDTLNCQMSPVAIAAPILTPPSSTEKPANPWSVKRSLNSESTSSSWTTWMMKHQQICQFLNADEFL